MTNYEVIETLINYNKEYNHVDGHSPEELDKADKKSMLRTRKGLMLIRYALEDYKYENQEKLTDEEMIGFSEVSYNIDNAILEAIENIDFKLEEKGFFKDRHK